MMTDVCIDPPCPISRHDNDREGAEVRSHLTEASFDRDIIGAAGTFHQLSIDEDGWLRSSNYVSGESGYQLTDTSVEFNEGEFRGDVSLRSDTNFLTMSVNDVLRGVLRPAIVFPEQPGHTTPLGPWNGTEIVAVAEDGETEGVRIAFVKDSADNVSGVYITGGDLSVYGYMLSKALSVSSADVAGYASGPFTLHDLFEIREAAPSTPGGTVMSLRCNIGGTQRYLPVEVDGSGFLKVTP